MASLRFKGGAGVVGRLAAAALGFAIAVPVNAQDLPDNTERQIRALLAEKSSRNPAQAKMDSHLVHAAMVLSGQPISPDMASVRDELRAVRPDAGNFVEVDIWADVTPDLLTTIASLGGSVESAFPRYERVRARLPLLAVEKVAGRSEVRQIRAAAPSYVNAVAEGPDSWGDIAHEANTARTTFNLDGTGVRIGVLSNGVDSLSSEQAKGNLPPKVTVLSGQSGSGDEGTALLEIVYTLAPGATLYFATGSGSEAQMANNIQALASAGCNVIVDDISYFSEGPFQDDTISLAVDAVTAGNKLFYFSSAGNSGSLQAHSSGAWQGDFLNSGTTISEGSVSVAVHSFGATNYDTLTSPSPISVNGAGGGTGAYELMWSDPLGESANDYDLFITDSSGNVLASSTNIQNGRQDPEEDITGNSAVTQSCGGGTCRILVVKHAAAATRALFLSTERGTLSIATDGATYGHSAAGNAFGIAATNATYAIPESSPGCSGFSTSCNNGVEWYSSDGPRQMFYNPDGSAITPGNVLVGTKGGAVLNKPDFTAADYVTTGVPGYSVFAGTSAAAPHAAAMAALLLQAVPTLTPAAMRAALTASAIDIQGLPDINVGAGVVMAPAAIQYACGYSIGAAARVPGSGGSLDLSIQANGNCPWRLTGAPAWISGAISGAGSATVALTVAANPDAARSAAIFLTAGGLTLDSTSILQLCSPGRKRTCSLPAR